MAPPAAAPLLTAGEVSSCLAAAVGSWLLFRQLVVLVLGSGVAVAAGGVGCLAAGSSSRLLAISWLLFLAGDQLAPLLGWRSADCFAAGCWLLFLAVGDQLAPLLDWRSADCFAAAVGSWLLFRQLAVLVLGSGAGAGWTSAGQWSWLVGLELAGGAGWISGNFIIGVVSIFFFFQNSFSLSPYFQNFRSSSFDDEQKFPKD